MNAHEEAVNLHCLIWKLREELAETRMKLGCTEDRLQEALASAQEWRKLYHSLLILDDTEVVDEG